MLPGALAIALAVPVLVQQVVFHSRRRSVRRADALRLPVGADGLIPGAQPIALARSATHAALLVHGFGDSPQTLRGLAVYLADEHGWTVRAPLLPGHGRSLAALDATSGSDWRECVRREYEALRESHSTVVLVGLSVGGALATIQAARSPELPALVLLAPYLTPPANAERLAPVAGLVRLFKPYLRGGDKERAIFDPDARQFARGYGAAPTLLIRSLVSVAHDARDAASEVRAATLLMHSRTDYRIPVSQAEGHPALFSHASACEREWLEGCGHVITVDYGREHVWARTAEWLARYAGAPASAVV